MKLTELQYRVRALNRAGQAVPCQSHADNAWLSEDPEERAEAAVRCFGCPLITECATEALDTKATHGIWGGFDTTTPTATPTPKTKRRLRKRANIKEES